MNCVATAAGEVCESGRRVLRQPDTPGTIAGTGSGSTQVGSKSPSKRVCTYKGDEIDCTSRLGVWSEERQCFVQRVSPQPAPDHPIWEGRDEGTIYQCVQPGATFSAGNGTGFWFWAPSAGAAGAPVLVDPVTLAEKAIERMDLVSPTIGMTPLTAGAPLLVGMDAWLWVENAGPHGYGPITRTATAGPVSVRATAKVTRVVWNLGDGTRLTCRSAGTPWSPDRGTGASPTCGHRYLTPSAAEPDGTFTVRATAHWQVEWAGAGQSGRHHLHDGRHAGAARHRGPGPPDGLAAQARGTHGPHSRQRVRGVRVITHGAALLAGHGVPGGAPGSGRGTGSSSEAATIVHMPRSTCR